MTQSQTVTVDQQEILSRANEVEAPMADPPTDVPITPCELTAAKNAAQQLVLSADNMRENTWRPVPKSGSVWRPRCATRPRRMARLMRRLRPRWTTTAKELCRQNRPGPSEGTVRPN